MKSILATCLSIISLFIFFSCKNVDKEPTLTEIPTWEKQDETSELEAQASHENNRMKFKLLESKFLDKNKLFAPFYNEVEAFTEKRYKEIKPFVIEENILAIQKSIADGIFTYEELTLFFLKRIYKYELDPEKTLHTIIALNPNILKEARERDKNKSNKEHDIYGMPVLLKDNINTKNMPTTAGAVVLKDNRPEKDAFIVSRLKKKGALILGKVNLSEWAYYFCAGCPLGYSAIGGQTLNPYGRKIFETGGSSAGSATSMAAHYAIAAVGSETSGSIISPSSQNSIVGFKPTVGVLSRTGIVPISHTLDTSGPMTRNTIDNAIVLDAMAGKDNNDAPSVGKGNNYLVAMMSGSLKNRRIGVINSLLQDSIYTKTIQLLKKEGATIVYFDTPQIPLDNFLTLLNLDMKEDLPKYLQNYTSTNISVKNLEQVMAFNQKDSSNYMPYNQGLFDGIIADSTSAEDFKKIKETLFANGNQFFQQPIQEHRLDAIISINNYHSGFAAVGFHPCLTVPMGYKESGEPISLTFISSPYNETGLLQLAHAYEVANPVRKMPELYR